MRLDEFDLETAAREARGNWQKFDCFGWHDRPEDCEEWAIVYTHNRDSDLLDQSNADAIDEALVSRLPRWPTCAGSPARSVSPSSRRTVWKRCFARSASAKIATRRQGLFGRGASNPVHKEAL